MRNKIVYFLLFGLPFVVFPFGISPFESPKVILAELSIIILAIFYANRLSLKKKIKEVLYDISIYHTNRRVIVAYGILLLLSIIHLLFFSTPISFLGNQFRMQGIFLLWLLIAFSLLSSQVQLRISSKIIIVLLVIQSLAAFLIAPNNEGRAIGTLGEPNSMAGLLLFLWPFLLVSSQRRSYKIRLTQIRQNQG